MQQLNNYRVFLSTGKQSDPIQANLIRGFLSSVNQVVVEYTGGKYEASMPDDCDWLVIVPPKQRHTKEEFTIFLGRGQYDIIKRAEANEQKVMFFINGQLVTSTSTTEVSNADSDKNWQNKYGYSTTSNSEIISYYEKCFEEDCRKKLLSYVQGEQRRLLSSTSSISSNQSNDSDIVISALLIYPSLLNK